MAVDNVETKIRSTSRFNILNEESAACSSVHLRSIVTVNYATRSLRGLGVAVPDRKPDPPQAHDERRPLRDPSVLLRPDDARRGVHDMRGWERGEYAPQRAASWMHAFARGEHGRCRFEVEVRMQVTVVFGEPEAVLCRCAEEAMQTVPPGSDEACGICWDEFRDGGASGPVNLPCSHAFHVHCMVKWLHRGSTCPVCRHDLAGMVTAAPSKSSKPSAAVRSFVS